MNSTLTFPDLPADHPLNTGEGIISLHSTEVMTEPRMFIDLPYLHDKHDRCGRTCRNCTHYFCQDDKWSCNLHDEKPARNPRARALKCKHFEHWRKAIKQMTYKINRK